MSFKVKVAVVGASGYSGEELVRLLLSHPHVELVGVTSRQWAGQTLSHVFPRFSRLPSANLEFVPSEVSAVVQTGAQLAFLALPHGLAHDFAAPLLRAGLRVLDLSADFRLKDIGVYADFYGMPHPEPALAAESVYGLVEVYRDQLRGAALVACPGCYPTSILLPLIPLLRHGLLELDSIQISSMSGVSGAGRNVKQEYLYAECNESVRAYGMPRHRHLAEIEQELSFAAGQTVRVGFVPHLIPITRGIHTTISAKPRPGVDGARVDAVWEEAYAGARFVRLLPGAALPEIRNVSGTNFIDMSCVHDLRTNRLLLFSAEDNLVKGAAGQAVQCMNVIYEWGEECGLI